METGAYIILEPPTSDALIELLYHNMPKGSIPITVETSNEQSRELTFRPNRIDHSDGQLFLLGGRVNDGTWVDIRGVLGEAAILFVEES